MFRDSSSLYIDELAEFFRDDNAVYYSCRKVVANSEIVCSGLQIDDGGNTPHEECHRIVGAACQAYEAILGFGTTKPISFFDHARRIDSEPALAVAELIDGEEEGDRAWCERSDLPAAAQELLANAEEAFEEAWYAAIAEVEAQHNREADEWLESLIASADWQAVRDALDNETSCASDSARERAESLLAEHAADLD